MKEYARGESNPNRWNRNPIFYPLNYGRKSEILLERDCKNSNFSLNLQIYLCRHPAAANCNQSICYNNYMKVRIEPSWNEKLRSQWDADYFKRLTDFVREQYRTKQVFPPASKIFAAFDACPFDDVKVVILGQDPYHDVGQANGLCFSVNPGTPLPPSLVNIFKEVSADTGCPMPVDGDLSRWARQGVLLLNTTLTVEAHRAGSHQRQGWEQLTDEAVLRLALDRDNIVFILWGAHAIKKGAFIDRQRHLVLTSPHPSPLSASRGFFGNHHFTRANAYLVEHGKTPIQW